MSFLNNLWYGKTIYSSLLQLPLLPFSGIFAIIAAARRSLYSNGLLKQSGPVVPVVVVGGITAGGSGKTPLCVAIVNELKERGFNPGVLSRGYKSNCKNVPCQVPFQGEPAVYGDEPLLIKRATGVPVVIDPKRPRGADYLAGLGVDVIVTDDGLQHYALDRDVEVCVLDGTRMLGNGHLLPAGPLREAGWRLKTVDSVVVTGAMAHLGYFPMMLKMSNVAPLDPNSHAHLQHNSKICALAGIGNPDRFYKTLEDYGFIVQEKVNVSDHGKISLERLNKISSNLPVVMTAKDAIKYQVHASELNNVFVFNVAASVSKQFFDDVVNKINQSKYRVNQRKQRKEAAGYVLQKVEPIDDSVVNSSVALEEHPHVGRNQGSEVLIQSQDLESTAQKSQTEEINTSKLETIGFESDAVSHNADSKEPFETPLEQSQSNVEPKSNEQVVSLNQDGAKQEEANSVEAKKYKKERAKHHKSSEKTTQNGEDKDRPIFAIKQQKNTYDPEALPSELKLKR